jgi:REP element-mobilizing transposase RayT
MSRDYKKFAKDSISHVYNRGNNKEKVFLDEQDYRAFLFRLGLALGYEIDELKNENLFFLPYSRIRIVGTRKGEFLLHAFCLMPNHFHMIIEQKAETSVSKLILKICTSYARYLNEKYGRVGHVFQDKFKAILIESNEQLMWSSAYIHMNPVKDGLVRKPGEYKWSSYGHYLSEKNVQIVNTSLLKSIFGPNNFEKETHSAMSKAAFDTLTRLL